jgi:peptidoglycan/LPS O-acetylase OafA/YrhL
MGLFRYFLAICVVITHSPIANWQAKPFESNGGMPIMAFFIISGFYMSLIFEKYQLQNTTLSHLKNFYLARALRIYPVYFVCLLCTFIFLTHGIIPYEPFRVPHHAMHILHTMHSKIFYVLENLLIFGQDFMRFLSFNENIGAFQFSPLMVHSVPGTMACGFTLLGQSWTLALELTFYLLVPFILPRKVIIILGICVASLILRYVLYKTGIDNYNFQNAFFPTALGIFLLGSLSHRIIYPLVRDRSSTFHKITGWSTLLFLLSYSLGIYRMIDNPQLKCWLFIASVSLMLPFLFCGFKDSKWDKIIGEMSFPVYMAQFLGIALTVKYFSKAFLDPFNGYYNVLFANLIGLVLLLLIARPVDKYRHAHFLRTKSRRNLVTHYPTQHGLVTNG